MTLEAPAKVNLWLRVLGRRSDGYHRLDTVFQSIDLSDRVTVTCDRRGSAPARGEAASTAPVRLRCASDSTADSSLPEGPDNLCVRAAKAYLDRWPAETAVEIDLEKRIPVAAGLGGGSSDAAAVLLALREILGRPDDAGELDPVARSLGADVPFFLVGGTARGRGRGDRIEPLPDLEPAVLWLVAPRVEVSTAAVFSEHRRRSETRPDPVRDEMSPPLDRRLAAWILGNDLEPAARALCPELDPIYTVLQRFGFSSVQLSGSGGVVFGIPPEGAELGPIARDLGRTGEIHVTRTLRRRAIRPESGP